MNSQKRILVFLVTFLMCTMTLFSWASAEVIFLPQASVMIDSANVNLYTIGSGRLDAVAEIVCGYMVDYLGFSYIRIQELRNGVWTTVKSVSSKYTYNALYHTYTLTYYGTPGMEYRAQAGCVAGEGNVTETRSRTSSQVTCN